MKYNRVVIDAMGGDYAPEETVKGALAACEESDSLHCIFVGDEVKIWDYLEDTNLPDERWQIMHTPDYITMEDSAKEAVLEKHNASINVAARLIRDNKGDALVSAGSTGATVMACSKVIPRMAGIERGVLAAPLPAMKKKRNDPGFTIVLDVGATIHCTVNQLVSFAIMGIHYLQEIMAVENPRVGLLNIGAEETKGHDVLIETNKMLRNMPQFNFIGNVEGKDIMHGVADVIVTEGITGNIVLKGLEGMAEMFMKTGKDIWKKGVLSKMGIAMLAPALKKVKKQFDYTEYGGAPMLGFQKLVVKAHGRSKAKAIKNAVLLAEKSAISDLVPRMEQSMKDFYMSLFESRSNG